MDSYATIQDIETLFRPLSDEERPKAEALLPIISDELRARASASGRDLDLMIELNPPLASVAKEVTVSAVSRILRQNTSGEAMSRESQTALGYSWSGSYAVPGGGIGNAILPSDLKRLGLKRPRYRPQEIYGGKTEVNYDPWRQGYPLD